MHVIKNGLKFHKYDQLLPCNKTPDPLQLLKQLNYMEDFIMLFNVVGSLD